MGMDTREAAQELGLSVESVRLLPKRLGVGHNNGCGWWFTNAEIEIMRNRPKPGENLTKLGRIRAATRPPHCPRCEILTPDGEVCEECRFIEAHGRYPVVNELTGVLE